MSCLRSFSFNQEVPDSVWNLFEGAEKLGDKFDYSLEVIEHAMSGSLNYKHGFCYEAYVRHINNVSRIDSFRKKKKFLTLYSDTDTFEDAGVCESKVSVSSTLPTGEEPYEDILNSMEIEYALEEINNLALDILIENRVNIYRCLHQASKGYPASINALKDLVVDNPHVGDLLKTILSSGVSLDKLFQGRGGVDSVRYA